MKSVLKLSSIEHFELDVEPNEFLEIVESESFEANVVIDLILVVPAFMVSTAVTLKAANKTIAEYKKLIQTFRDDFKASGKGELTVVLEEKPVITMEMNDDDFAKALDELIIRLQNVDSKDNNS